MRSITRALRAAENRLLTLDQKWLFLFALAIIGVYFGPYLYLGENAPILIHDNLDSNVVWVKSLLDNGGIFVGPTEPIDQVFNGLPRSSLYGTYDFSLIWFELFGMFWGYVINKIILSLVAFFGMYYLLKTFFLPKDAPLIIPAAAALMFSLLPFWSFTLSVAGLPLALYAFLGLRSKNNHALNWIIIILFPFYSSLVISGVFFLVFVGLVWGYDCIKTRSVNWPFFLGMVVLGLAYVVSHFPLFYSFIAGSEDASHRTEIILKLFSFSECIDNTDTIFRLGQYHAHSHHKFLIIPILGILIFQIVKKQPNRWYVFILAFIVVTAIFFGFHRWEAIGSYTQQIMSVLPIQLQRFHFLHPMLWYILFGVCMTALYKAHRYGKYIVLFLIIVQFRFLKNQTEYVKLNNLPSYKAFYAESLFDNVKTFINEPLESYRVISIGLHPCIAQYNGMYVLDGYYPNYPLSYKHQFRKVIAGELERDSTLEKYFDNWGSRCYAFSSEIGTQFMNPKLPEIQMLNYDFEAFKQLGGQYILSSTKINDEQNLKWLKTFKHSDAYWTVFLYAVL